jgi:hypothetical protein
MRAGEGSSDRSRKVRPDVGSHDGEFVPGMATTISQRSWGPLITRTTLNSASLYHCEESLKGIGGKALSNSASTITLDAPTQSAND